MQGQENSSYRSNAKQMTEDNRQKRLKELKGARQEWRDSGPTKENMKDQIDIFNVSSLLTRLVPAFKKNVFRLTALRLCLGFHNSVKENSNKSVTHLTKCTLCYGPLRRI